MLKIGVRQRCDVDWLIWTNAVGFFVASAGAGGNGAIGSTSGSGVVVKKKRPVAAAEPASFSEPRPARAAGPRQKKQADDGELTVGTAGLEALP